MTYLGWLRTNMLLVSCKFEACGIFFFGKKKHCGKTPYMCFRL